jgi:drug/metabolite transporter (DMT)-like permease
VGAESNVIRGEAVARDAPAAAAPSEPAAAAADRRTELRGLALATVGVALFSFSLPATRLAVADLDPMFVSFGRAAVAALLAAVVLAALRAPRPHRDQWRSLAIVAFGVVAAFPLFTALALRDVDASHGAVVIAVLPAWTAVFAVLRAGESPSAGFWLAAAFGLAAVLAFIASQGLGAIELADVELLVATVFCSLAYAEGGALSRTLGGPQTICWALLLAAPLSIPVAVAAAPTGAVGTDAWLGFAYVSLFSMFLAFFLWYAGLARGGVAKAGQTQLLQTPLTLALSALVLGENVPALAIVCTVAVLASIVGTQRARVERRPQRSP